MEKVTEKSVSIAVASGAEFVMEFRVTREGDGWRGCLLGTKGMALFEWPVPGRIGGLSCLTIDEVRRKAELVALGHQEEFSAVYPEAVSRLFVTSVPIKMYEHFIARYIPDTTAASHE